MKLSAQTAAKWIKFLLCRRTTDLYIAVNALKIIDKPSLLGLLFFKFTAKTDAAKSRLITAKTHPMYYRVRFCWFIVHKGKTMFFDILSKIAKKYCYQSIKIKEG